MWVYLLKIKISYFLKSLISLNFTHTAVLVHLHIHTYTVLCSYHYINITLVITFPSTTILLMESMGYMYKENILYFASPI